MNETVTNNKCVNYKKIVRQLINDIRKFKRDVKNFVY